MLIMQIIFCLSLPHTPNKTIENDYLILYTMSNKYYNYINCTNYTNYVDLFVVNVNYYFLTRKIMVVIIFLHTMQGNIQ